MEESNQNDKFACPCCGYMTLGERAGGTHNICQVCFWEDDPIQLDDPDSEAGANRVSLRQAQKNFLAFGASERTMMRNIRPPNIDEMREANWNFLD